MHKVLASSFQEFDYIYRQAFSYQLCGPLSVAAFIKCLVLLLITTNTVNASRTNFVIYFIYSVNLLHFKVFVKKTYKNSLKTCFLFFPYNIQKKCVHGRLT